MWSTVDKRQGGLTKDAHRRGASQLASAFVELAFQRSEQMRTSTMEVFLDSSWRARWPRPAMLDIEVVSLEVQDGMVSLAPLKQVATAGGSAIAIRFWQRAKGLPDVVSRPVQLGNLIGHLLVATRDKAAAVSFAAQLCIGIATRVELALLSSNNCHEQRVGSSGAAGELLSRWTTWKDLEGGYQLDHHLVRYVLAGREASLQCSTFVVACDAHDGCGKKLFNIVIGLPNNVAIVAPPQARGSRGGGGGSGAAGGV